MSLLLPYVGEFLGSIWSTNAQPAAAYGTTVTPGQNAMGAFAQLLSGASVTESAYGIAINFNSGNQAGQARDTICDIGIDPAGGTTYTVLIPNLLASMARAYIEGGHGINYFFPLFIDEGTSIACRASVNNATVNTIRCIVRLLTKPKNLDAVKVGSFVKDFGTVTGSSRGTLITPGTTAEGAWTQLGSNTVDRLWFWSVGMGVDDATTGNLVQHVDVGAGDATNKRLLIENQPIGTTINEQMEANIPGAYADVATGVGIFGRAQGSLAADSNTSLIAYGVGG